MLHFGFVIFFFNKFEEEVAWQICFDKKKLLLRQSVISKYSQIWTYLRRTVCAMAIDLNVLNINLNHTYTMPAYN